MGYWRREVNRHPSVMGDLPAWFHTLLTWSANAFCLPAAPPFSLFRLHGCPHQWLTHSLVSVVSHSLKSVLFR
ncbi:hypothetical protein RJT34_31185 [Clitoria ternatea]|uniref:Uncharacterized protein n=1 Tax=Clitoria ternatea TaxID=43366 RepID=A0AAN9EUV4_CLITE